MHPGSHPPPRGSHALITPSPTHLSSLSWDAAPQSLHRLKSPQTKKPSFNLFVKTSLPLLFLPLRSFWKGWSTLDLEASQVALVIKNPPANLLPAGDVRDVHLITELGRSPGGEHGNPLQYSCLENTGQRSLAGYSPRGHKELDTTEAT